MTIATKKPLRRRIRAWRHARRNRKRIDIALESGNKLILVHQMGKVGSSSIMGILQSLDNITPFHIHWCNARNLSYKARIVHENQRVSNRYGDRNQFGLMLNDRIIQPLKSNTLITMFRDPVARNISSYFQHLDEIWGVRRAHDRIPIHELTRGFQESFEHDEPIDWFDTEILDIYGVDLFSHEFDRARRWSIIKDNGWSVLAIRSDLPDSGQQEAVSKLIERPVPAVKRQNVGEDKAYADIYRAFQSQIQLPDDHLDRLYSAPATRYFFSEDEIRRMRERWESNRLQPTD
ncbi:MAG: putative capsular polysaccharide synthesis family protein [Phycisphaerales bacterium]|nr:putative capsular polysaccharide synthesis family protein [Phycisphaerales bacterium]